MGEEHERSISVQTEEKEIEAEKEAEDLRCFKCKPFWNWIIDLYALLDTSGHGHSFNACCCIA